MDERHCEDCCCARSWKALGITEYTGKSIPEHITELQSENERLREEKKELGIMHDKYVKRVTKMMLEQGFKINYEGGPTVFD